MYSHILIRPKVASCYDIWTHHLTAAAKERNCVSRCKEEDESRKLSLWMGFGHIVYDVKGIVFELLSIPIFMNNDRKYSVEINTTYPVLKFFSRDCVDDMLVGNTRQKAIETVDQMIFDKMISQKAYHALAPPVTKLHANNLYLDFEKTRDSWSKGGPLVEVDQALLRLAQIVPVDIYNKRFLDKIDHDVYLSYFNLNSMLRGQRLFEKNASEDTLKLEAFS
jgi:hypothetical protein